VDYVLCEDTRETGKLLKVYRGYRVDRANRVDKEKLKFKRRKDEERFPKLVSYNDYNRDRRIPWVIGELEKGKNVALVADRGTPLVSDPGYKLVQATLDKGIKIEVIPGASAVLAALVVSGLPPDTFQFVGFLPKKSVARKKLFKGLPEVTVVAYEAPYRLVKSLRDLREVLGEVEVAACVELTKMYERVYRGKVSEVIAELGEKRIRGEVAVVFRKNES
jgi:16S rRNA (cytidine1402-2'-O)-methyltransferase